MRYAVLSTLFWVAVYAAAIVFDGRAALQGQRPAIWVLIVFSTLGALADVVQRILNHLDRIIEKSRSARRAA